VTLRVFTLPKNSITTTFYSTEPISIPGYTVAESNGPNGIGFILIVYLMTEVQTTSEEVCFYHKKELMESIQQAAYVSLSCSSVTLISRTTELCSIAERKNMSGC
jgi:hypothetical protein